MICGRICPDLHMLFSFLRHLRSGGELFDRLVDRGNFSEQMAASVMKQVLQAVAYCHSKKVAHRDLKVRGNYYTLLLSLRNIVE